MKQKNNGFNTKWLYLALAVLLIGGILYVAAKDITPISHRVETDLPVTLGK